MSERSINNKSQFITALMNFVATKGEHTPDGYGRIGYRPHRGELALVAGIADSVRANKAIVGGDEYSNWLTYLPEWLDETFEDLRTAKQWQHVRDAYARDTGYAIPSLVNFHEGGLHRLLVAKQVVRLIAILAYLDDAKDQHHTWLEQHLESYVFAQDRAVEQAWHRFVRGPYRKLMPRIKEESHRGNSGLFGKTTLLSYAIAGRVMFTFEREIDKHSRHQVSFVADDSDMLGHRSGGNSTDTPFMTCIEMIHDVVDHWDIDKFVEAKNVGLG